LILVLTLRVEPSLSLLLLHSADVHERPNIADVELLTKFTQGTHLRPKAAKTLAQSAKLTSALNAKLAGNVADVCQLTSALQAKLAPGRCDVCHLPRTLQAQLPVGGTKAAKKPSQFPLTLLLLLEGLLGLLLSLLEPSGPKARRSSGLLLGNVAAQFPLSNRLTAAAKRTLTNRLRANALSLHLPLTSDVLLRLADNLV
jgi:hypothetical protein